MAGRVIMLGGQQNDGLAGIFGNLLLIGGLGVAGFIAYKYFIEGAAAEPPEPECTEGEVRCINNFEYVCIDGELEFSGETCLEPECVDGSTQCSQETETIWACAGGEWVDTQVSCAIEPEPTEILSLGYLFWYEGTQTPIPGMPCTLTDRTTGAKWTGTTDASGVVKFYNVPLSVYTLAMYLEDFHFQDYDKHTPFGDWAYVDVSGWTWALGEEWQNPNPWYMLKNVPSADKTIFRWLSDGGQVSGAYVYVLGKTEVCDCSDGLVGCMHPQTSVVVEVRNRWNELINAYVFMQRQEDDNVCFSDAPLLDDGECTATRPIARVSAYRLTLNGMFKEYTWANNNNKMGQRISVGVTWNDPLSGDSQVFGVEMVFNFTPCTLSAKTCFEGGASLDNTYCP